ncbi:alpha/beta fold hydrolase [Aetokthonos hydrillicola Thurmond2011]|jgi:esterase/lipase|uniref:Alpha/beta fold hydrolase n=1 Tax=Aetokthonos hydrillicola Thurmond2011 TaxID=2712845 RepID=A0AAP5I7R0_9CYAN|nr:alpha/beta fold hydrolase [Aetokthonos hydrillicola]MBO3461173.1 alpha/beta fold hydrolase [Aetokthonos hydrillicola CCALA 1050]MBW4588615.1 alpha/beta fold hydrolase [Aetokthonos hydrillicola CCALA 1050]MDR9896290.1 alpha/beta fold hydrolase [Aetokthonos hydrillicola Thurmond2011]
MSNYSNTISEILHQADTLENALPIRNEACRSKFFFHPQPTTKVCLFFHGFTAGPYQFEPLGKAFFEAGYNVLIPLQPGHGMAGNWNSDNPPPLPTEAQIYQEFAISWLKVAQNLGEQVIVGGLSSGGTLASWLALECGQQIEKALLFSPYLGGNNIIVDFLVQVLPIYYEWPNKDNSGNHGYDGFLMPALRLFLDMGQGTLSKVKNSNSGIPMFIVTSESDEVINRSELKSFFLYLIKQQPNSWYYSFDKFFDIPHTMMTQAEGNRYQDLLITIAKAYVESGITWRDLIRVGYQILHGKTLETAVTELNLIQEVSPELFVLLAVIDKKTIIDADYLHFL